jgi:hypothetical protein
MAFGASPYYGGYTPQYPQYQPTNYQPMQSQPLPAQPPMQTQTGLNRVTGIEGARAFQVPPNSVVPLFDDTQDVFYIKTTDSGGFPTLKGYRFSPIEDSPTQPAQGLTRPEVEQIIREELAKYEQQSVSNNIYSVPPEYKRPKQHDGAVRSVSCADAGAQSAATSE